MHTTSWITGVRVRRASGAVAVLLSVLAACEEQETLDAGEYDASCSADIDCTLVSPLQRSGDTCTASCERQPIRRSAEAAFRQRWEEVSSRCSEWNEPGCLMTPVRAACQSGRCVLVSCGDAPCTGDADAGAATDTADASEGN